MKNPFAWCFGRGKKGRRKPEKRQREEPVADEPVRLRYPLFDPRTTETQPGDLPPTPSDRSSCPSVPEELDTHEKITLPKDEEEEETPFVEQKQEEGPKEVQKEESPAPPPSPKEAPADAAPPPAAAPAVTPPVEEKTRKKERPKAEPGPTEATPPRELTPARERSRSRPTPSGPSVSPEPPSTTGAVAPPSTPPEAEASVPLSRQTQPPSSAPAAPVPLPPPPPAASNSQLAESAHMRKEAAMSPLEKLASARLARHPGEALEEAEAATAPCTPPEWEEGPVVAETEMQQLERTRRLQQKLLALEESLDAEELQLCHDSTRRRRKVRREFPRYRVSWRCVQAAIDFYADVQDGILEDIRMRLDAHEPKDCRICRNIDYSDVPVLP